MSMSAEKQKGIAEEHISYEINMFYYAFQRLIEDKFQDSFDKNAFIEIFVVHARCLTDFLYPPDKTYPDDVLAEDFFDNPSSYKNVRPNMHELIQLSKVRANKEVAHLTYARLGLSLQEKNWDIVSIEKELKTALLSFYSCLNDEQKTWLPKLA